MQLPKQAQPVMRTSTDLKITYEGAMIYPQGCGFRRWLRCASRVGRCVTCGSNAACWVSCLGSSWSQCRDCVCREVDIPVIC